MYQNKVTLIGFLGNDAEVRTANDRSFTTFSLATKSSYKDKNSSQYVSHTEWHRCVVFGKLSEFAKTLTKGAHVQVNCAAGNIPAKRRKLNSASGKFGSVRF
jgi:single-strand DNA-binding protein